MRARVPTLAGVFRVVGLAGTAVGCVMAIASLSDNWAVDGPREGIAAAQTGWQHMAYGDLLLTAVCALVLLLAGALCIGPRSRRTTRLAGGAALSLLLAALAGVVAGYWLSGLDVSVFGNDTVRQYDTGPGYTAAATGLVVALFGLLVLLAGRWEARTRKALKREATAAQRARAAAREADREPEPTVTA